jgi:hypothetical protein
MSHASCADCGLRFSAAFADRSRTCPMCCGPLRLCATAAEVVGQQLYFEPRPEPRAIPPPDAHPRS